MRKIEVEVTFQTYAHLTNSSAMPPRWGKKKKKRYSPSPPLHTEPQMTIITPLYIQLITPPPSLPPPFPQDIRNMALMSPKVVTLLPHPPPPSYPPSHPPTRAPTPTSSPPSQEEEEDDFVIHLWDPTRPLSTQLETVGAMMPIIEGADIMPAGRDLNPKALNLESRIHINTEVWCTQHIEG